MGNTSFLQRGVFALGMCALALAAPAAHAADKAAANAQADDDQIIAQARASYYSLKREGMAEFRCSLMPNWEQTLAGLRKTDAAEADRRAKIFPQIHFDLTVPIGGSIALTHNYTGEPHPELAGNFDKIYHGMDQMIRGFFMTWNGFMVSDMLPKPGQPYTLEKVQSGYRIYYVDGGADALILMDQDMVISSLKVSTAKFESTIRPKYQKIDGKLVLVGFDAVYLGASPDGKSPGMKMEIHVKVDNQLVDGFQIPKYLDLQGASSEQSFAVGVGFADCHAKRPDAMAPAAASK